MPVPELPVPELPVPPWPPVPELPEVVLVESEQATSVKVTVRSTGASRGVRMAQELLLELKELPKVQGVYLMPSFGRYELACQVLEVLSPAERGAVTVPA